MFGFSLNMNWAFKFLPTEVTIPLTGIPTISSVVTLPFCDYSVKFHMPIRSSAIALVSMIGVSSSLHDTTIIEKTNIIIFLKSDINNRFK